MKLQKLFCFTILLAIVACNHKQPVVTDKDWEEDSDRSIDISEVKTVLPQAGNVALVEANCTPCHSLRYIEMQPEFPLHTWEKIVDKMITAYGAPVRDSVTRQDIINYLYAIRGKKS